MSIEKELEQFCDFAKQNGIKTDVQIYLGLKSIFRPQVERSTPEVLADSLQTLVDAVRAMAPDEAIDERALYRKHGLIYRSDRAKGRKALADSGLVQFEKATRGHFTRIQ